ncbi:MAG: ABC transporter permease [Thermoflexales bacterium]
MWRYLRVFGLHAQGSLMAALEYRVGFLAALGMSLVDALWAVGGAWVFYAHRPTLGGWRFEETLVVVGLFFLASGFLDALLQPNLRLLIERIRTGQLDYMLIRPLNPMAYATMQRQRFEKLSSAWVGLALIGVALMRAPKPPTLSSVLSFAALLLLALLLLYALMALLMALCFWAVDLTNVEELLFGTLETARYPVQAFPEPLRAVLSFVVPIAFVSTVPAEALLGRPNWALAGYGLAVTLGLLLLSRLAWRAALRQYCGIGG